MSMIFWQECWTLGIDLMDAEHQALVRGINQIIRRFTAAAPPKNPILAGGDIAGDAKNAQANLIPALELLADLAREHFKHEEALMRSINYPELASHRSEHALLLAEYIEMVRDLERQSVTHLDAETMNALHHWLVGHMVGADKDYADHYFGLITRQEPIPDIT